MSSSAETSDVPNVPRVAWVLINATHYHLARWREFQTERGGGDWLIELTNSDAGMKALEVPASAKRITLFPGTRWCDISREVRHRAVWSVLDKYQPRVVCVNGWSYGGSISCLLWALKNDARVIAFSDSNSFDFSRNRVLESYKRAFLSNVDAAVCAGHHAFEYLNSLGVDESRIFKGYDVVDNSHFNREVDVSSQRGKYLLPNKRFFLSVARMERKKNHIGLLRGYRKYLDRNLQKDTWDMVLVGGGVLREEIEDEIKRLGLNDRVLLLGEVKYQDLPSIYHSASAFVHVSKVEQWGLVVNEAMAASLPVIVSHTCGCAVDLVQEGLNGLVVDPFNDSDIAHAMGEVASDENVLAKMAINSEKIIGRWSTGLFSRSLCNAVEVAMRCPVSRRAVTIKRLALRLLAGR